MPRPSAPPDWRGLAAAGVIAIATGAAYANSLGGPFVYDDLPSIVSNPTIRHLWPLGPVLHPPGGGITVQGRPLVNLSLAINYALGGSRVQGYHGFNLICHVLAALAWFGIVRHTLPRVVSSRQKWRNVEDPERSRGAASTGPGEAASRRFRLEITTLPWAAVTLALLWSLHPLQTEAVTYVVQRAEVMMGLFYLTTLYCFIRGAESERTGRTGWFGLAIAACALGMATKEVMVSAPPVVLLYDRTFLAGSFQEAWRRRRWVYGGLAATWILLAYLVIGAGGNRGGSAGFDGPVSWGDYALTQFAAIAHYLRLMLWPSPLVFDYGPLAIDRLAVIIPAAFVVAGLAIVSVVALVRWPVAGFLGFWFFAVLAPTSLIPGPTQMIVEHRMYLALAPALAAVFALLWCGGERQRIPSNLLDGAGSGSVRRFRGWFAVGRRNAWDGLVLIAGLGLGVAAGSLTARRNTDYRTALALWSDTLAKRPDSARAHNEVAVELSRLPGHEHELEAITHYEAAVRLSPTFAEAQSNLGIALMKLPGREAEAVAHLETAVRLKPDYAKAQINLADALARRGDAWPEAVAHYQSAVATESNDPDLRLALGNALLHVPQQTPAAQAQYEAALRLRPDYAEAHFNLANLLAAQPSRLTDAFAHYQAALRLNPNYAEAELNWADALAAELGGIPEALKHYRSALRIRPNYPAALNNRAVAFARIGRWGEAIADLEAALKLDPSDEEARQNLKRLRLKRVGL